MSTRDRLDYLRGEIRAERISYGELAELQGLAEHIDPSDTELLEWAGVPEEHAAQAPPGGADEYEDYALFMCTEEDRWLIGGLDTVDDPDDDDRCTCRHCGAQASECDGFVHLNRTYET